MVREATEGIVVPIPRKDIGSYLLFLPSFHELDNGESDWTDRSALFAVCQTQATCFGVYLRPLETDNLAAAAASQRDLANNVDGDGVFLVLTSFPQHFPKRSILRFG